MYQVTLLLLPLLVFQTALIATSLVNRPGDAVCTEKVYVGDIDGNLAISGDAGETWTITTPITGPYPDPPSIYSIYAIGEDIYLGTKVGFVASRNGGRNWTAQELNDGRSSDEQSIPSVFAIKNRVWAGIQNAFPFAPGTVCISDDNGRTWPIKSPLSSPFGPINAVCAVGNRTFVGTVNGLGISDDDGNTWKHVRRTQGFSSDAIMAIAADGDNISVASTAWWGTLSLSQDGGQSWRKQATAPKYAQLYSLFTVDGKIYAGTHFAGLSMSEDGGKSWVIKNTQDGLASNMVYSVAAVGNNIYLATFKGLSVSRDGGQTWTTTDTGLEPYGINTVFAQCV